MVTLNFNTSVPTLLTKMSDLINQPSILPPALKYGNLENVSQEDMLAQLGGAFKKKKVKKNVKKEVKKKEVKKKEVKKEVKKKVKKNVKNKEKVDKVDKVAKKKST